MSAVKVREVVAQPVEATVGADRDVQGCGRGAVQARAEGLTDPLERAAQRGEGVSGMEQRIPCRAQDRSAFSGTPAELARQQVRGARRRPRHPALRLVAGGDLGLELHGGGQQVGAAHAVEHAVVALGDDGEAALLQTFHDPDLPERPVAVEGEGHDVTGQPLEQPFVSRMGQAQVADVVVQVEARVVHPVGGAGERHPGDALPVAWVEHRLREAAEVLDVHPSARAAEAPRAEDRHGADVHRRVPVFDLEEAGIQGRETFAVGVRHGGFLAPPEGAPVAGALQPLAWE